MIKWFKAFLKSFERLPVGKMNKNWAKYDEAMFWAKALTEYYKADHTFDPDIRNRPGYL